LDRAQTLMVWSVASLSRPGDLPRPSDLCHRRRANLAMSDQTKTLISMGFRRRNEGLEWPPSSARRQMTSELEMNVEMQGHDAIKTDMNLEKTALRK